MSKLEDLRRRIDAREARIGVIGLGYVGLPLAVELANAGFRVTGFWPGVFGAIVYSLISWALAAILMPAKK